MKTTLLTLLLTAATTAAGLGQGTAFTYQGRLNDGTLPATGFYDLRFTVHDAVTAGTQIAGPLIVAPVGVTNGLFTVRLDFGSGVFNGAARWLQVGVRTNGSVSGHTILAPRQAMTAAPYAVTAGTVTGNILETQLPSNLAKLNANQTFTGNINLNGAGSIGIGTASPIDAKVDLEGTLRLNDFDLWLRTGGDRNHGVGYRANAAGRGIDGPFVYGFNGGALGVSGPDSVALQWDFVGNVWISNHLDMASFNVRNNASVNGSLGFGASTRQMLNLWNSAYGIGVQNNTLYQRTDGGFAWFRKGSHSNNANDPGSGGSALMTLDGSARLGIGTASPQASLDVATGAGNLQVRNEGGITPGLNVVGGYFGIMRLRRGVEIWPDDAGTMQGMLDVRDASGNPTITLNGNGVATVKVLEITGGADIAEPFQMSKSAEIPKGAVVVIDEDNPGHLKMSEHAYDSRVAGIVSGANGINPGLALHQQGKIEGGQNVALTGRVYAMADASEEAIKPGDLLTTSNTPGHVMRASNRNRSSGAILGKAMTSLKEGRGLVLVLVSLQ